MYRLFLSLAFFGLILAAAPAAFANEEVRQESRPPRSVFGFAETQFLGKTIPVVGSIGTSFGEMSTVEYSFFYASPKSDYEHEKMSSTSHTARFRYFPSRSLTFNFSAGWSIVSNRYTFRSSREKREDPSNSWPSSFTVNLVKTGPELAVGNWWQWSNFGLRFDWFGATMLWGTVKESGSESRKDYAKTKLAYQLIGSQGVNIFIARSGIGLSL